jgi:hypothetical protein
MVHESEQPVLPFHGLLGAKLLVEQAADIEDVLEPRVESKLHSELDLLVSPVPEREPVRQRQRIRVEPPAPLHVERVTRHPPSAGELGVGELHCAPVSLRDGHAQGHGRGAVQPQLIGPEEAAVVVVEAEPVIAGSGNLAVGLRDEEEVALFENDGVGDRMGDRRETLREHAVRADLPVSLGVAGPGPDGMPEARHRGSYRTFRPARAVSIVT